MNNSGRKEGSAFRKRKSVSAEAAMNRIFLTRVFFLGGGITQSSFFLEEKKQPTEADVFYPDIKVIDCRATVFGLSETSHSDISPLLLF